MLKKNVTKLITLIAMLVICIGFETKLAMANDATATYNEAVVNKVKDITMSSMEMNVQSVYVDCSDITENGTYNYYYQFTLDKPAYFQIDTFTDVVSNYYAEFNLYLSKSKVFNESIIETDLRGETRSYYICLEAGTYYLKLSAYINGAIKDNKNINMQLYAQDISRTTTALGNSKDTAINMSGKKGTGLFTQNIRIQWFKFTLNDKSDVTFTTTFNAPNGWKMVNGRKVRLYDKDGLEMCVVGEHAYTTLTAPSFFKETVEALPAGTYYIQVEVWGGDATFATNVSYEAVDKYAPSSPKVVNYKSGNKYIKGNAEKGSTVYVKYNGKTTKAKTDKYGVFNVKTAALKVGKTVQVWAVDANKNKSQVTKVTIKNRQLSKPKVKTYKKNTKVIKGTAKKGTTVYVTYAGKTYKKKMTSSSYSIKVSKKLTKGATIKVKVEDSVGNYSKTVTVKVK